jgi:hypothetical protein
MWDSGVDLMQKEGVLVSGSGKKAGVGATFTPARWAIKGKVNGFRQLNGQFPIGTTRCRM